MFASFVRYLSVTTLAVAGFSSAPAFAGGYCELVTAASCTQGCYSYAYTRLFAPAVTAENCDDPNMVIITDSFTAAPSDPALDCKVSGGNYVCEAWPQGPEISYAWLTEEASNITNNAINPFKTVSCSGGEVSVAVIGPGGGASVVTTDLPACH